MKAGGVVLCGGQSRRMGRPKASLPFGDETMLARVLRLLHGAVDPLVVVASPRQQLPRLPSHVYTIRDREEDQGPLEGLFCGLSMIRTFADAAFVTSCDVPLLRPALVHKLVSLLAQHDAVVPVEEAFSHPLTAVYRTAIVETIHPLLEQGRRRLDCFFDLVATLRVPVDDLRDVDPDLYSLMNINCPEDYALALQLAALN